MSRVERIGRRATGNAARPRLRLVSAASKKETIPLELTYGQLVLVHKSLQAAKTLDALGPQVELLDYTLQQVDIALTHAL
jgi:hypothetical protein